eukprot:TRINITY_DN2044_c0_g1::TRINITY_DN2044_c0_g1_i2::g.21899::m.21899 TRINITY_DN2044_c0_g1::TRINITY_DN2044_c0_g1_i2::g.21899  ORF type:complete len:138 (+),score=-15.68,PB1/PF00564.19/0.00019 TRINITY_DN2044_c0_g1_i2:207-620(+)
MLIKTYFQNHVKYFELNPIVYTSFLADIHRRYDSQLPAQFQLIWTNSNGDQVIVNSDDDLRSVPPLPALEECPSAPPIIRLCIIPVVPSSCAEVPQQVTPAPIDLQQATEGWAGHARSAVKGCGLRSRHGHTSVYFE